jgi:hypothetical protein
VCASRRELDPDYDHPMAPNRDDGGGWPLAATVRQRLRAERLHLGVLGLVEDLVL